MRLVLIVCFFVVLSCGKSNSVKLTNSPRGNTDSFLDNWNTQFTNPQGAIVPLPSSGTNSQMPFEYDPTFLDEDPYEYIQRTFPPPLPTEQRALAVEGKYRLVAVFNSAELMRGTATYSIVLGPKVEHVLDADCVQSLTGIVTGQIVTCVRFTEASPIPTYITMSVSGPLGITARTLRVLVLPPKRNALVVNIVNDSTNVNLEALARSNGWDGNEAIDIKFNIQSGIKIGSASSEPALVTGTLTKTKSATLVNQGKILGRGGNGCVNGSTPTAGGLALQIQTPITIENLGTIGGGGGGGGCGGTQTVEGVSLAGGSGGGGQGYTGGNGASAGTADIPGAGGSGSVVLIFSGGSGGAGGSLGQSGATGVSRTQAGTAGAAGGKAVQGKFYATWKATGTIHGAQE